ncbi:hypothetical protein HAX54_020596 [Datura stramonium]|uniref:Uncharacterized protein n=1 Tax=Datura stramonium TaxID=4076 RepID=A0ABS8USY6_DATST|nr:hypothetical protein [Datura stramonium]
MDRLDPRLPGGVANYFWPLISNFDKEKMEDLLDYCLFNKGMHATTRTRILIREDLELNIHNDEEIKAQLALQDREIIALRTEMKKRREEVAFNGHIKNLKVDLEKAKQERHLAFQ